MKHTNSRSGFTLLELLTVIAIIAILAAILFPVFKAVKDNAKRAACATNLHDIGVGLQQYKLDNRRYPMALLASYDTEATPPVTVPATMAEAKGGLFPEYVKSLKAFKCPNANVGDVNAQTTAMSILREDATSTTATFFMGDSYSYVDLTGSGNLSPTYSYMWARTEDDIQNILHFQPSDPDPASAEPNGDTQPKRHRDFARQLRWRTPDSSTVVTWCLGHRSSGEKALVLFLDGNVDVVAADAMIPDPAGKNILYRILPQ